MDKYEFNIKVEQIKKLVNKKDYSTAMKIADTIDWKRVRNVKLLTLIAQVYEYNDEFQESKDILLLAYERAPIGKRLVYKLTELAIKESHITEAESYYDEFVSLAPNDARQYILRFLITQAKEAPISNLIPLLESYKEHDFDEKWSFELAKLYQRAGREDDCVKLCDDIMLWFSFGKYVEKAMELKTLYQPLTDKQQELIENKEKYEEKVKEVERAFSVQEMAATVIEDAPTEIIPVVSDLSISTDLPEVQEMPEVVIMADTMKSDPELAVRFEEAQVEEKLAKEMSMISVEAYQEEGFLATKEMPSIRRTIRTKIIPIEEVKELRGSELSEEGNKTPYIEIESKEDSILTSEVGAEPLKKEGPFIEREHLEETEPITELNSIIEPLEEFHEAQEKDSLQKKCFIIKSSQPRGGIQSALELIRQINAELGTKSQVVKISGTKLNNRGVLASIPMLTGRDLIIEQAYDLTDMMLDELKVALNQDQEGKIIVLIDTPERINSLYINHPGMTEITECIEIDTADNKIPLIEPINKEPVVSVPKMPIEPKKELYETSNIKLVSTREPDQMAKDDMELDAFVQYACDFARDLDCAIDEMAILAVYAKAEEMLAEGEILTREQGESIVDSAIEKAEKRSVGKFISGVFSSRYNKEGLLLLREAHFKE